MVGYQNTSVNILIEAINCSIEGSLDIVVINRAYSISTSSNIRTLLRILYMKNI